MYKDEVIWHAALNISQIQLDSFHVSIWGKAHRKHLQKEKALLKKEHWM